MFRKNDDYRKRVGQQIQQFSDPSTLLKLPKIHHLWMFKYIRPRILEVFGVDNALQIYSNSFKQAIQNCNSNRILSIGAGDCSLEINIAKQLLKDSVSEFTIECTELSDVRLERGRTKALEEGVCGHMEFKTLDINTSEIYNEYAGIMAHHVLHHIVELESLFSKIHSVLEENGAFVSIDMIGRNGHMRHPEALVIIERLWRILPEHYKYNHQLKQMHHEFVNWDCAKQGFEGIRAQDILPLLIENFSFERFFAYGNIIDPFIERGYGHNLDVNNQYDLDFIDFVQTLNELLIDLGYIKPTMMFAVMKKMPPQGETSVYKNWTPECCVRKVNQKQS